MKHAIYRGGPQDGATLPVEVGGDGRPVERSTFKGNFPTRTSSGPGNAPVLYVYKRVDDGLDKVDDGDVLYVFHGTLERVE